VVRVEGEGVGAGDQCRAARAENGDKEGETEDARQ